MKNCAKALETVSKVFLQGKIGKEKYRQQKE